jgi:hypothetical protein
MRYLWGMNPDPTLHPSHDDRENPLRDAVLECCVALPVWALMLHDVVRALRAGSAFNAEHTLALVALVALPLWAAHSLRRAWVARCATRTAPLRRGVYR